MSPASQPPHLEETLAAVPFTCRLTAAYRWIEHTRAQNPVLHDPLAVHLAGEKALKIAEDEWGQLQADQGTEGHFRVPARSRIIDDAVISCLTSLTSPQHGVEHPVVQIVCLGAGMDTRPWRLELGNDVSFIEVDQSEVVVLKQKILTAIGAQTNASGSSQYEFPLRCRSWAACSADLTSADLEDLLTQQGFSRDHPTIWIAEGLLYYMPLPQALTVLRTLSALSLPGSFLLGTCIDAELHKSHKNAQHVFANLWHFSIDDLILGGEISGTDWKISQPGKATWQLCKEQYDKQTYIPLVYSGHEEFFVATKPSP